MRIIQVDGSPEAADALAAAVADALDGGPAVLPLGRATPMPVRTLRSGTANHPTPNDPAGASDRVTGARPPAVVHTTHGVHDAEPVRPAGLLVATSGSTRRPRLVVLPATALRASATATAARLGGPGRWLLALPADHVAGVQVVVRALLAGVRPIVQDLREGFRPDGFTAATARLGAGRRYTSLVPTQLLRLLDAGGPALDALRSYDAVLVGGAALDAALRVRAEAAGVRVVATYGMTETAGGCVYDGVPLEGVRARLDDDGLIVIGGPTLAAGYLDDPAATATAFDDRDGGREFRTNDLGRWVDCRLEVLGRADDVIVTGGEKVAPAAVERVLVGQAGVRAACVVGLPDPEWGVVVGVAVVLEETRVVDGLRDAVRDALGRAAVPRVVRAVDALPLRGIGKPDRTAVARLLARPPIHTTD